MVLWDLSYVRRDLKKWDSVIRDFSKLYTIPFKFDGIIFKFWEILSLLDSIKVMGDSNNDFFKSSLKTFSKILSKFCEIWSKFEIPSK